MQTRLSLKLVILMMFLFLGSDKSFSQQETSLFSPDHQILIKLRFIKGIPEYNVSFKDRQLIKYSSLGLSFLNEDYWGEQFKAGEPVFRDGEDNYTLIVGKTKEVRENYKEVSIPLHEDGKGERLINLKVRVYNSGLAFRYEFPEQKNWSSYILADENTTFNLEGNPVFTTLFLPDFTTSHEGHYSILPFSKIRNDTLMDLPTLITFPEHIYLAITEAALLDYAGMYLIKKDNVLKSQLSPLPSESEIKVKAKLPHSTPWRVLLISDNIGELIESNIITSLSEPCRIKDVSWIKPGKSDFHWWNGDVSSDSSFVPGINFEFNKYYIDFCSENNIEYHSVIGYNNTAWYQNDGEGYLPGPHSDVTKPLLDMKKICDYGEEKNVGIRVWVHWAVLYPKLEEAFALFEKWGIQGMMVDFLDRDDQEMVNIQTRILQKAAEHHLHIQFHGAYKPTGLSRTYPNEFTREGTLNYEYDKWGNIITPDDDINIPFTRGLAGSTDYHLGGFNAIPMSEYKAQEIKPYVVGTRCHMLAMYVVLQSSLQMVCDYPEAYKDQPGFDFIRKIPTVWDKTKVVNADAGEWLSIARMKDNEWYIGTITNHKKRKVKLNFNFLPEGKYSAEIYSDAPDSDIHPNKLEKKIITLTNKDIISVNLTGGGGQVIHLSPVRISE